MECCQLLYWMMFLLMLKSAVDKCHVKPVLLYGSEAWCLKKCMIGNFVDDDEIHCKNNVWISDQG